MAEQDGIRSITDARRASGDGESAFYESELWARLAHASDASSFAASWLDIQCRAFDGVIRGAVVLRTSEAATFAPVALWPEGVEGSPKLAAAVESALAQRRLVPQAVPSHRRRWSDRMLGSAGGRSLAGR